MKKILFIVLFLFGKIAYSQNFQGKVLYKSYVLENVIDSTTFEKKNKQVADALSVFNKSLKMYPINFELKFTNTESLFQKQPVMKKDNDYRYELAEIYFGAKNIYYANSNSSEKITNKEVYGAIFLVVGNMKDIKWTLTNQRKKIGNYSCLKATSILKIKNSKGIFYKEITAWYAPKIPVSFGPKDYCGLPGLILELIEGNISYSAYKLILNPKEKIEIFKPKKGKIITQEELDKIGLSLSKNNKKD
ncbi:GLPGLI family protein [Polaribacter sp.]|uniref:GLPGLI family protein n=1 Tax=Polaribacter sp. TaxID=1920175 RepID=UPI004048124C